ncbi:hypothetical protein [Frankia sp. CiP1_Cm_nod2]|uniref:hypothetical protein n=1 Tax=Frankia sp. CiP1_Cm_nod2 TaxID=2897161 RepID=UPI002024CA8D
MSQPTSPQRRGAGHTAIIPLGATGFGATRLDGRHAGVGRRTRLRLWWRGRRDAGAGIPTSAPASFVTPAIRELAAGAERSHSRLRSALTTLLIEIDTEIAETVAAIAVVRAQQDTDPADRMVADAEALGQPATSDDAAARTRRRAAQARTASLADRGRLSELRIRLAGLLERRERLIDDAEARADEISSFRDQCVEVYRAANLRRRGEDAAALAEAWVPPAFPPPAWLTAVHRVPTATANGDTDPRPETRKA